MLSPGKFYQSVPKQLEANLKYRLYVYERSRRDEEFRRQLMNACREDCLFWIATFAWQYNPDKKEVAPFIPWGREQSPWIAILPDQQTQEEAVRAVLDAVHAREDVKWQKSREVGASWLVLLIIVWLCLFHRNIAALAMSRNEDAVDDPDNPDSLFWKVRFIHKMLPTWMTGQIKVGQVRGVTAKGIREKKGGFVYERTHSFFNGTANVKSAGVGGRKTIMLVDEFGQFDNGHETYSMTSDTTHCRVFVFTHKDNSGMAYSLCFDTKYATMREIVTHWTQHPIKGRGCYRFNDQTNMVDVIDKTFAYKQDFKFVMEAKPTGGPFPSIRSPWYDAECIRRTDRDVSMNLDIDPRGAADRVFDTYRINQLILARATDPCWIGRLEYNKETGRGGILVQDPGGNLKLWINPKSDTELSKIRAGAGADIAAGSGYSPSCLSMMKAGTGEKFLEYANALIPPTEFAVFVAAMCWMVSDSYGFHPLLGWEIQYGQTFDKKLRQLGYEPCYVRQDEEAIGKPLDPKLRRGVNNTNQHLMPMMLPYREALYKGDCTNPSREALLETLNFVYTQKSGGIEWRGPKRPMKVADLGSGATIHHGDLCMADVIAYKMVQEIGLDSVTVQEEEAPVNSLAWRRKIAYDKQRQLEFA